MKPADVRFYFDADILGVAQLLASVRSDITYPGDPGGTLHKRERPACPITDRATPDEIWIPEVTQRGWLIVTRDLNIKKNLAEREAVRMSGARMVALSGPEATTVWNQLEILMTQWRRIEGLLSEPGPFIRLATRTNDLPPIELD